MNERYRPYAPLNELKPVGPNLWIADGPALEWKVAGISLPFPTRMTLARLANGDLWVHSPIRPDENLLSAVDALGPVRHFVSPNKLHHVTLGLWSARYPAARVWASPGVRERSNVHFTDDLGDAPPAAWRDVIDQRIASGSNALKEVVFFHRPSRTLILTDLIENFETDRVRAGFFAKLLMRLGGVMAPRAGTPRDLAATFRGRHHELAPVVQWMLDCDPEKVIISHGKWFDSGGRGVIRNAFAWVSLG